MKEGIKMDLSPMVQTIGDLEYVGWAAALAAAGRPAQRVVTFGGSPCVSLGSGALVAVEQLVCSEPSQPALWQRTWLPVLDAQNRPMKAERMSALDVQNAISRCRAKSLAMVGGVGLSLYAGYGGRGLDFVRALKITPSSDLAQAEPLTEMVGGARYVRWAAALAAARLTDPGFFWEVLEHGEDRALMTRVGAGYFVAVRVVWRGQEHTEWLPIMRLKTAEDGSALHVADTAPDAFSWNTAVMRCMTKAIAVLTGYGLSVYADEDLQVLQQAQRVPQRAQEAQKTARESEKTAADMPQPPRPREALLEALLRVMPQDPQKAKRVLSACKARGLTPEVPSSAEDLVQRYPAAAEQVLAGLVAAQFKAA